MPIALLSRSSSIHPSTYPQAMSLPSASDQTHRLSICTPEYDRIQFHHCPIPVSHCPVHHSSPTRIVLSIIRLQQNCSHMRQRLLTRIGFVASRFHRSIQLAALSGPCRLLSDLVWAGATPQSLTALILAFEAPEFLTLCI